MLLHAHQENSSQVLIVVAALFLVSHVRVLQVIAFPVKITTSFLEILAFLQQTARLVPSTTPLLSPVKTVTPLVPLARSTQINV